MGQVGDVRMKVRKAGFKKDDIFESCRSLSLSKSMRDNQLFGND